MLASLYGYCLDHGKVVFAVEDLLGDAECPFEREPAMIVGGGKAADSSRRAGAKKKDFVEGGGQEQYHQGAASSKGGPSAVAKKAAPIGPVELSAEEVEKRRVKFRGIIENARDERKVDYHDFPKGLNARERLIVHEICEVLGLAHQSQGEGKKRFVRVVFRESVEKKLDKTRPDSSGMVPPPDVEDPSDKDDQEESSAQNDARTKAQNRRDAARTGFDALQSDSEDDHQQRPKNEPSASSTGPPPAPDQQGEPPAARPKNVDHYGQQNDMLARLAAQRQARHEAVLKQKEDEERLARHKKLEVKKQRKAAKKSGGGGGGAADSDDDFDDFDAIVDEFRSQAPPGKCQTCKVSTTHLDADFTRCEFCRGNFCFRHIQAECHGCGDAASHKERGIHQKKVPQGVKAGAKEHARSKAKLEQALKEKAAERTGGTKKSGKKK